VIGEPPLDGLVQDRFTSDPETTESDRSVTWPGAVAPPPSPPPDVVTIGGTLE